MFCKKCGSKNAEDAKFCTNCGTPLEVKEYQASTPPPFSQQGYNQQGAQMYEKTAFKGHQASAGTSGHMSFGSGRRPSFIGKLIKLGALVVVAAVLLVIFFGDNSAIHSIGVGTGYDTNTSTLTGETNTLPAGTSLFYTSYGINGVEAGSIIKCDLYYLGTDAEETFVVSDSVSMQDGYNTGYFSFSMSNGWISGEYELRFFVDGELINTKVFQVE